MKLFLSAALALGLGFFLGFAVAKTASPLPVTYDVYYIDPVEGPNVARGKAVFLGMFDRCAVFNAKGAVNVFCDVAKVLPVPEAKN